MSGYNLQFPGDHCSFSFSQIEWTEVNGFMMMFKTVLAVVTESVRIYDISTFGF